MMQTGLQLASMDGEIQLIQQQEEHINIPVASHANLPCLDLLTGDREDYINIGLPLYKASVKGDWKAAKAILDHKPELVRYSLTENGDTPLHVVAAAKQTVQVEWFVEDLVDLMTNDELALENKNQDNALYLASVAGNIETVKILVEKNSALLNALYLASGKMMPLQAAALYGKQKVVRYLYAKSNELADDHGWTHENRSWLLLKCVETDIFDIALRIVKKYPELGRSGSVLGVLARKPEPFKETKLDIIFKTIKWGTYHTLMDILLGNDREALQLLRIIWKDISKKPKNVIDDILRGPPDLRDNMLVSGDADETYSYRILFVAAEMGNTIFIVELIRRYPDLIWQVNDNNKSIFHIAARNRDEDIYNLLYEIGGMKDLITPLRDKQDNNMLHIVAKSVNQKRLKMPGVFQMQRELLWFLEIESMIPPSYREQKNKDYLTPRDELFTEEHKSLRAQAEKWMKATANQSMVIAVLVATIAFAAAFTIPGGYDQNNGIPMFRSNKTFLVFVISDAISLVSSSTSIILMFLTILRSPYAETDFLRFLPKTASLGLATLFLSLSSMMITFSASFFILYDKQLSWIPILIASISMCPTLLYIRLHTGLFYDVFHSTYGGTRFVFNPKKNVLY